MRRARKVGLLRGHRLARRRHDHPRFGIVYQVYCTECGLQISEQTSSSRLYGAYMSLRGMVPDCESESLWAREHVVRSVMKS